jgi:hypothetical protein
MGGIDNQLALDVQTPLGFRVRSTHAYWEFLVTIKHPAMSGRERDVETALAEPDEVRRSRVDGNVLLFYKAIGGVAAGCVQFAAGLTVTGS